MKDSGVAWIGKVPVDWKKIQVGKVYNIELGKMLQPLQRNKTDTLEKYICALNVFWDRIDVHNLKDMWFSEREKVKYELQKGDLIVVEGGDVGTACIWNGCVKNCYIQNAVHMVRPKTGSAVINEFLYYWLFSLKKLGYFEQICSKATFAHFTKEKFVSLIFLLPPLDIQKSIVCYLNNVYEKTSTLISKIQSELDLITKYKTSLISSVITGKVDVRNVAVPDFEPEIDVEDEVLEDAIDEEIEGENNGKYKFV